MDFNVQCSKEGQDLFANFFINDDRRKYFIDLGCAHPKNGNNTYMLENKGWEGLIVDQRPDLFDLYKQTGRNCICKIADLTDINQLNDVCDTFIENFGKHIDYLSFDVDAATVKVIENFPFEKLSFGLMTFEHDIYHLNSTNKKRDAMLSRLSSLPSYKRLVTDIGFKTTLSGNTILRVHEDWWYNAAVFNKKIELYNNNSIFWKDYLNNIDTIKSNNSLNHYIIRLGGGIGDMIKWYCNNEPSLKHIATSNDNKILVSCNSHNQFSTEFITLAPYNDKCIIFDPEDEIKDEMERELFHKLTDVEKTSFRLELENRFIQKKQIKRVCDFRKIVDNTSYNLYPTINDLTIIGGLLNEKKPFIVLAPGASTHTRVIPNHILQSVVGNIDLMKYNIVLIGKSDSNIKFKHIHTTNSFDLPNVINLMDKLTIQGTLKLLDHASGLICSDSSILHYGSIIKLPMCVIVPDKHHKPYGLMNVNDRHQGYFGSFGQPNVVVTDFRDYTPNCLVQFISNVEQQP
jgi:hypothetical protein